MSFNRSGYIGRAPGDSAITIAKQYYQPTGVQTDFTFSSGYSPGLVDVYRNGVKLINVLDYAATDGSTISLDSPVGVGSTVQVVAYKAFNLATVKATELDTTVTGTNLTLGGDLTVSQTTTTVDINVSGSATVTGTLVAGSFSGDGSALTGVASTDNIITGTAATFRNTAVSAGVPNVNIVGLATVGILTAYGDIAGTTGTFSGAVSGTTGTFSAAVSGTTGTFSGAVNVDATTDSTSSSTGALIVDGGLGVAKNVYIGAGLSVAGTLTYEDVTNVDSVGLITAKSGVNVSGGQLQVGVAYSVGAAGVATALGVDVKSNLTVGSGITMGSAGVATFSGTADVHLHDNVKLNVGDGSDLSLYHDGTRSYINNTTGPLYLESGSTEIGLIKGTYASGEWMLRAKNDAEVAAYYNNSKKWETTNDGTVTTGIATATVGIDAAISVWTLGASGTNHYTFTGPGNLSATNDPTLNLKRGQKYTFKNRSGGHPFRIQSTPNGSAGTAYNTGVTNNDGGDGTNIIFDVPYNAPNVLYYQCTSHGNMGGAMYIDGSAYEISIGAGVTIGSAGVTTFSGTADVHLKDSVQLKIGDASDLALYHNASGNSWMYNGTNGGDLYIGANAGEIYFQTGASANDTAIKIVSDASVELYENNIKRLETTTSGISVENTSGDTTLLVTGSGQSQLTLTSTSGSDHCSINFGDSDDHDIGEIIYTNSSNQMAFIVNATTRLTIGSAGISTFSTTPHDDLGSLRDIPLRSVTGSAATLVVADAGKVVSTNTTGWTVPASTFSEGDTVTLLNNSAGGLTITCSAVTTYLTSDGSTVTSSTLGARGLATLYFVSASVAYLQGTSLS